LTLISSRAGSRPPAWFPIQDRIQARRLDLVDFLHDRIQVCRFEIDLLRTGSRPTGLMDFFRLGLLQDWIQGRRHDLLDLLQDRIQVHWLDMLDLLQYRMQVHRLDLLDLFHALLVCADCSP